MKKSIIALACMSITALQARDAGHCKKIENRIEYKANQILQNLETTSGINNSGEQIRRTKKKTRATALR